MNSIAGSRPMLSVVVPAYNESDVLPEFNRRLLAVLDQLDLDTEIVYVNDGSTDDTLAKMKACQAADGRVAVLDLSRNYGKEIALSSGLQHARGDAAVPIDADLQDPPELIPRLVEEWRNGFDVVYAKRISREGDSWLKKASASLFYHFMERISGKVKIPRDTGDFRLISRKALDALNSLPESHRFMKGLFALIGFRQKAVEYHRDARFAGTTKWNYWALWNLSIEGITSFTIVPLKLSTYIGLISALMAFSFGLFILLKALIFGDPVAGYPSLMVVTVFVGGMQLMGLGIIGEYVGRIFNETKNRPLYFVQEFYPSVTRPESSAGPAVSAVKDEGMA